MLLVDTLALGAYQTNCYLVRAEGSTGCCVLDPGDADVYPGHGETTALARERRENPYLRQEATPWN